MRTRPGWGCLAALCLALSPVGLAGSAGAATTPGAGWTVYHGDPVGDGEASAVSSVDLTAPAWTSPSLDGQLYGEPLIVNGTVFVATENDTVYALNPATGAIVWSTHLGSPVPASALPCGDISPTVGITGTPVIDAATGEIFVVADEDHNGTPAHMLVGLSTTTGKVMVTQDVDPPGATTADILQRTGLTLDGGRVVFGYGGNYGDCGTYKGWVVSVPESGGTPDDFAVDGAPGEDQGAVWMGGAAPTVDAKGDVWVSAGNGSITSSSHAYDDSDSVLELSPAMALLQYFAPRQWASDNASDLDFSTAPALLADGEVLIAGKSRIVYLLNGADLGGIGGQQVALPDACGDVIDGGMAVDGNTVYLPCVGGVVAVQAVASPPALRILWRSSGGGCPPIVAGGLVWSMNGQGELSGLDPATGAVKQQAAIGAVANHFPTPSAADGLLVAPAADRVVAFTATSSSTPSSTISVPPSTTSSTTAHAPVPHRHPTGNSPHRAGTVLLVLGAVVVVGGAVGAVIAVRRRRRAAS